MNTFAGPRFRRNIRLFLTIPILSWQHLLLWPILTQIQCFLQENLVDVTQKLRIVPTSSQKKQNIAIIIRHKRTVQTMLFMKTTAPIYPCSLKKRDSTVSAIPLLREYLFQTVANELSLQCQIPM